MRAERPEQPSSPLQPREPLRRRPVLPARNAELPATAGCVALPARVLDVELVRPQDGSLRRNCSSAHRAPGLQLVAEDRRQREVSGAPPMRTSSSGR